MKLIPLTQGKFVMVDDEDFETVNAFKWYAHRIKRTWYAARNIVTNGKPGLLHMHRMILPGHSQVDHIDTDGLNNTRRNLRPATCSTNGMNQRVQARKKWSRFKGVTWSVKDRVWAAQIQMKAHSGRKRMWLGGHDSETAAARAYDAAAKELFGDFARLNFPDATSTANS